MISLAHELFMSEHYPVTLRNRYVLFKDYDELGDHFCYYICLHYCYNFGSNKLKYLDVVQY